MKGNSIALGVVLLTLVAAPACHASGEGQSPFACVR